MGDYAAAQESLQQSIAIKPDFPGAYLELGFLKQFLLDDVKGAVENYEQALRLDPQFPVVLNNLGFLDLVAGRYAKAIEHLGRALAASPRLVTAVNLGDVYRYSGDHSRAAEVHRTALEYAASLVGYDRYIKGDWTFAFLPLAANDTETTKGRLNVQTRDQKLAIAHFALALDYAAAGNISAADGELEKAVNLERQRAYGEFYANKIDFMLRSPQLGDQTRKWLAEQRAKLSK